MHDLYSAALLKASKFSLEANLEISGDHLYLTAGRHQFRSLWTRDFCFAAQGLARVGHAKVIENQLLLILRHVREDGVVPRSFDGFSTKARVCISFLFSPKLGKRLRPEYLGEHRTPAADSSPLLILECLRTQNPQLREELIKRLPLLLRAPSEFPLRQPAFSDWQDSARRTGPCFYLNLCWWAALQALERENLAPGLPRSVLCVFDSPGGLPWSSQPGSQVSFDGALLGLRFGYWTGEERKRIWLALRNHPVWRARPGVPVSASYPPSDISWTTRLVGLSGYHDSLSWTWLLAIALGVAKEMNDHAEFARLGSILFNSLRENMIPEVLNPAEDFRPFRSPLYRAERPFAWASGLLYEALTN